jgi:hypothetical protein
VKPGRCDTRIHARGIAISATAALRAGKMDGQASPNLRAAFAGSAGRGFANARRFARTLGFRFAPTQPTALVLVYNSAIFGKDTKNPWGVYYSDSTFFLFRQLRRIVRF